jgi:Flp pilus assembly pilin Flp
MGRGLKAARLEREAGAASVEYALLISGIAVVLVAVAFAVGVSVYDLFDSAATEMGKVM